MLAELTSEELSITLDAVAAEVLDLAAVAQPPVDAFALAAALGVCVARDDRQQGRARYQRLQPPRHDGPQPAIFFKSDPRAERQHWAVAHEIGEHVAHRVFGRLGVDPRVAPPNARESMASQLAGRLLLPAAWFEESARETDWDLLALKRRFDTASHELIARRMLDCRPPVVISIFDEGRLKFRLGNLAGRTPPLQPIERECRLQAHSSGCVCHLADGLLHCACYPIHEPGFRREILRTQWPDEQW